MSYSVSESQNATYSAWFYSTCFILEPFLFNLSKSRFQNVYWITWHDIFVLYFLSIGCSFRGNKYKHDQTWKPFFPLLPSRCITCKCEVRGSSSTIYATANNNKAGRWSGCTSVVELMSRSASTNFLSSLLRPRPHYAGGIWKRRFILFYD